MKKYHLMLAVALLPALFTACKKDKPEPPVVNKEYEESGWELDHISQQRIIRCPYCDCGEEFAVDFADYSDEQESEGSMGQRCEHVFDIDDLECPTCGRLIHVKGVISEYPVGAYEYERINIEEGAAADE